MVSHIYDTTLLTRHHLHHIRNAHMAHLYQNLLVICKIHLVVYKNNVL